MRYFVRRDPEGEVDGPFSVSEIIAGLESGDLNNDFLASGDLGETGQQLQTFRRCDWCSISNLPGVRDFLTSSGKGLHSCEDSGRAGMPYELKGIFVYYILIALGYVYANVLQVTGMARVLHLPPPIYGVLIFLMWLGIAFCILTRVRWGWHFCLVAVSLDCFNNFQSVLGQSVTVSWYASIISVGLSIVIGIYLLQQRNYFTRLKPTS